MEEVGESRGRSELGGDLDAITFDDAINMKFKPPAAFHGIESILSPIENSNS